VNLKEEDIKLFYKLDWGLLFYANNRYKIMALLPSWGIK